MLKVVSASVAPGLILDGIELPTHVVTAFISARGQVSMTLVAVVDTQELEFV